MLDTEPERYCEETGLWVPCALTEDWSENGQRCDLKFSCAALQACRLRLGGLSNGPFSFRMASTSLPHASLHPACMLERPLWLTVPSVGLADQAAPVDLLDRVRLAGLQGQDARFVEAVQQSHAVHVADGGVSDRSGALGTRCVWPGGGGRPLYLDRFCATYPRKEVDHAGKNKPGKWWRNVRAAAGSGTLIHSQ